jgi:2,3-dihydroxybenzoate decarboxylase
MIVQSSGPNGEVMLHYDQPNYDVFWKTVQELDIPVYMHPRLASPVIQKQLWEGRQGWGPQVFSTGVSIHTLGLCGNGVFDRFPKVQFVIGHLGEGLPADIWRLDHCKYVSDLAEGIGMEKGRFMRIKCKKPLIYYFKNNIHITTSGHYSDETLKMCMNTYATKRVSNGSIGTDRIIYSIDTAYEWCEEGAKWWDNIDWLSEADKKKMGRDNAIKLLKLENVPETPVTRTD